LYARDTRTLERYVDVVKGRKRPKYRILKMIPVSFNPSDSTEKLWSLHDSLLEEYLGIEAEDDSGRPRSQFALTEILSRPEDRTLQKNSPRLPPV
jgi:uncharacterized Fe-S radical SAM superfamily protein PflX